MRGSSRRSAPPAPAPQRRRLGRSRRSLRLRPNRFASRVSAHHDQHIKCAPAYLEYGRALLRKAQQASDPFGSKLPREGDAKAAASSGAAGAKAAGDAAVEGEECGEEEEDEEEAEGEEADDLELAFQCLEMARLIYEKVIYTHFCLSIYLYAYTYGAWTIPA